MISCGDMHGGVPRFDENDDKKKCSKNKLLKILTENVCAELGVEG